MVDDIMIKNTLHVRCVHDLEGLRGFTHHHHVRRYNRNKNRRLDIDCSQVGQLA